MYCALKREATKHQNCLAIANMNMQFFLFRLMHGLYIVSAQSPAILGICIVIAEGTVVYKCTVEKVIIFFILTAMMKIGMMLC